jgi:hypothetical protein
MSPRNPPLPRTAALVALGGLIVHQLRYLGAYGGEAGRELAAQGHGYLGQLTPLVIALALAGVAGCLVRAALTGRAGRKRGPLGATAVFAGAILATFAVQETVEGFIFAGHLDGLDAVFGGGGWLAVPLALVLGFAAALLDAGLGRLESALAALAPARHRSRRAAVVARRPQPVFLPRISPLALGAARRPPPVTC